MVRVESFQEKPPGDGGYINGGFFVLSNKIFDHLKVDNLSWEDSFGVGLVLSSICIALTIITP